MIETQTQSKPLSAWVAVPLILLCLVGGGWMAHWYISTDQLTHESTILDSSAAPAVQSRASRNNRAGPAVDNTPPIQRLDPSSNVWWIHSRDAAAQIESAGKGQPITVKAVNYNTYKFVPQEQTSTIFAARRIARVDTSTAHVAGAMGKPVWILNRFDSCWRWFLDREDSPWYPTAKLYRQQVSGDWQTVIEKLRTDLLELAGRDFGSEAPRG